MRYKNGGPIKVYVVISPSGQLSFYEFYKSALAELRYQKEYQSKEKSILLTYIQEKK